jgi:RNA polymerase sigma factor (sigma-70 family)
MSDVTRILEAIDAGDPQAAAQLLPLVYDELRKLAAAKMAQEKPGQTLDATALVHEAYMKLVSPVALAPGEDSKHGALTRPRSSEFANRGHFFAAAAEAMRRILVDQARRKLSDKRGGEAIRLHLAPDQIAAPERSDELLFLDEALTRLAQSDPQAAELVKLRFFAGLTMSQAAETLAMPPRSADRLWAYARAWLFCELNS